MVVGSGVDAAVSCCGRLPAEGVGPIVGSGLGVEMAVGIVVAGAVSCNGRLPDEGLWSVVGRGVGIGLAVGTGVAGDSLAGTCVPLVGFCSFVETVAAPGVPVGSDLGTEVPAGPPSVQDIVVSKRRTKGSSLINALSPEASYYSHSSWKHCCNTLVPIRECAPLSGLIQ